MKQRNIKYQEIPQQVEEIIQLRVQLAKNKSKIQKYQQFVSRSQQYDSQLRSIFQQFSRKINIVYQIATFLGLQLDINKANIKNLQNQFKWQKTQYFSHLLSQYQYLVKQWQTEQNILKQVKRAIINSTNQNKQLKAKVDQLQHTAIKLKQIETATFQFKDKHKQSQVIIQQKNIEITRLQQANELLQQKVTNYEIQMEQSLKKQQQLMDRITELSKKLQSIQQESIGIKSMNASKQKVIDNCKSIIDVLSVAEDDYLTNYFRQNGLPFQVQKPQKNKYSIVFDQ